MRTIAKGILTGLFLILTIGFVFGQKGVEDGSKYGQGADSISCIKNFSIYRSNARQNNYDNITQEAWKLVYTECPKASQYIYIDGVNMVKIAIKKEEDAAQKEILIDSMMRIYDKRIKYFNRRGSILGRKGVDFITSSEKTVENMQEGYEILKESISLEKYNSRAPQLLTFFQASNSLFQAGAIEAGDVVADFGTVMEIADYVILKGTNKREKANVIRAKPSIEQIFEDGGAANCDDLVPYYANKFNETPEDIEFLKKATDLLKSTKCTDSEIYFNMAVKLNIMEPTADLAYELAKRINKEDKLNEAVVYYKQAIELQEDDLQKAKYYLELGDVTRRIGDYSQSRTYALKSIELDATSGYPYLLIGNIYAASSKSCSEEEFEQKAVYWAAVDQFAKAKSVDPELADDANKFIDAYKPHFPDNETIFFYNYKQGDSYTVGCWINEKTTVRAR
ncbi:MAG: tetratricopeptide repeat protein [Bacteroidales bacterium]|jgi:tetratricopeptide (TPR) repeat protein|nr:tetratricopeptide repeat protein [Bacteroidales bacterium]